MRRTRMNTASCCHSRLVPVAPFQSKMRNGMEEVAGSIPTRSTMFSITYSIPIGPVITILSQKLACKGVFGLEQSLQNHGKEST